MPIEHFVVIDGHPRRIKDRVAACLMAFFAGSLGIHKFYLGRIGWGVAYILLCWTGLPFIAGIVEGIIYLTMTEREFDAKYRA